MAHFAGLVAGGVHPSPVPHAPVVTSTTHKTLRGPRAGLILCAAEHAKAIDKSVFPGTQGGPLEHIIAAKAVAFGEALTPDFARYAKQVVANAQTLAEELIARGFAIVSGGTDTHLMLVDLRPEEPHREGRRRRFSIAPASRSTRTPSPTIPSRPSSPAASAWGRRRSPPGAWAGAKCGRSRS